MTRICTICARGGSKGVPGKNLRPLLGRPLIAHTVGHALDSGLFDLVAVSSDSRDILSAAEAAGTGLVIHRPAHLASDTAGKIPAIAHALAAAEAHLGSPAGLLVDLDATSPLRHVEDVRAAVDLAERTRATSVITGSPARRSPYFNLVEERGDGSVAVSKGTSGIVRRQDSPRCFDMNASIYVWQRDAFVANPQVFYPDTRLFEMPEERSHDIDTPTDWALVEFLLGRAAAAA